MAPRIDATTEERVHAGRMEIISLPVSPSRSILLASSSFPFASTKSRSFCTTWVRAISAIMAGSMSIPYRSASIPKVYLHTPVTASVPMAAIRIPRSPDKIPFARLSPLTPAIREIPRIAMEKYSTEANLETRCVIKDAHKSSRMAENRPPKVEANREVSSAFLTFPFFASG